MTKKMTSSVIAAILLTTSSAMADEASIGQKYIVKMLEQNPQIKSLDEVIVLNSKQFQDGWQGELIEFKLTTVDGKKDKTMIKVFNDGKYIVQDVVTIEGEPFSKALGLPIYQEDFLIHGRKDADEKLAIFSDPQCPFCKENVSALLDQASAKGQAVFFFDLPLDGLHPNSRNISTCMITAIKKNPNSAIDIIKAAYKADFSKSIENIEGTILKFNSVSGVAPITYEDVKQQKAEEHLAKGAEIAYSNSINSTPTVLLNGKRL